MKKYLILFSLLFLTQSFAQRDLRDSIKAHNTRLLAQLATLIQHADSLAAHLDRLDKLSDSLNNIYTESQVRGVIGDSLDRLDDSLANIYTEAQTDQVIGDSSDVIRAEIILLTLEDLYNVEFSGDQENYNESVPLYSEDSSTYYIKSLSRASIIQLILDALSSTSTANLDTIEYRLGLLEDKAHRDSLRIDALEQAVYVADVDSQINPPLGVQLAYTDDDSLYNYLRVIANTSADTVVGEFRSYVAGDAIPPYAAFDTLYSFDRILEFIHTELASNTIYDYRFRSKRGDLYSIYSPPHQLTTIDTTTTVVAPDPPINLVATTSSVAGQIWLSWGQSSEVLTPIKWTELERRTGNSGAFGFYKLVASGVLADTNSSLTQGILYQYRARNWNHDSLASTYSNISGAFSGEPSTIVYDNIIQVSQSGNDNNDGAVGAPVKTLTRAIEIANATKDLVGVPNIQFRKGDTWTAEQLNVAFSGTPTQPFLLSSYGSGNKPVLSGNNTLPYVVSVSPGVQYVKFDGLRIINNNASIAPLWTGGGLIRTGQRAQNIEITNCEFYDWGGTYHADPRKPGMITLIDPAYVTISNCDFTGRQYSIFVIANYNNSHYDGHNLTFTNNYFHKLGNVTTSLTSGNFRGIAVEFKQWYSATDGAHRLGDGIPGTTFGAEGTFRDILLDGNRIDSAGFGFEWYRDPDFLHTNQKGYNWVISNNDFNLIEAEAIGLTEIGWRNGQADTSIIVSGNLVDSLGFKYINNQLGLLHGVNGIQTHAWDNAIIENNIISNFGTAKTGDGHAIILDIAVETVNLIPPNVVVEKVCDSVIVRNNFIYNSFTNTGGGASAINIYASKRANVYNNVIWNTQVGIYAPWTRNRDTANVVAFNTVLGGTRSDSTFIITTPAGVDTFTGKALGISVALGTQIKVYNNIVSGWNIGFPASTTTQNGIVYGDDDSDYKNNILYDNVIDAQNWADVVSTIEADPLFVDASNPLTGGLNILPTSPALNAGLALTLLYNGHLLDILGNTRTGTPTIGAYGSASATPDYSPLVISANDSLVAPTTAIIGALINGKGISTVPKVKYGETTDLDDSLTMSPSPVTDSGAVYVTGSLSSLTASTEYYFAVSVTSDSGYSVTAIDSFTTQSTGETPTQDSTIVYVNATTDDAWHNDITTMQTTFDYNYLGNATSGSVPTTSVMNFRGITIPAGSTILGAWLEVVSNNTRTGNVPLSIQGFDTSNVASFTTGEAGIDDVNGRDLTTATETGTITESWSSGVRYRIPIDLADIVQELLDSYSGFSNEGIGFLIEDTGAATNVQRRMSSYEYSGGTQIARLVIYYEE